MAAPFLATYEDVLSRLDKFCLGRAGDTAGGSVPMETMRGCAEQALREIMAERDWGYFRRTHRVALSGIYNTGSITYAATGDTYSYEVTLASGTWPAWAASGEILLGNLICQVDARKSDTVITLKAPRVPVADLDAGSSYTLGRSWYPLPSDFAAAYTPGEKTAWFIGRYRSMDDLHIMQKYRSISGTVQYWSIGPAPEHYASMALHVHPWPASDSAEDLVIKTRPRSLVVSGKDSWNYQGTVTVAEDGTAVTGSGTDFRTLMEGAIIRFSADSTNLPTAQNAKNPYNFQQSIASVTDATNLTLSAASSVALSGVKYVISDPVDVMSHLYDAFIANAQMQLAYETGMKGAATVRNRYLACLAAAKAGDSSTRHPRRAGIGRSVRTRLSDYKTRPEV